MLVPASACLGRASRWRAGQVSVASDRLHRAVGAWRRVGPDGPRARQASGNRAQGLRADSQHARSDWQHGHGEISQFGSQRLHAVHPRMGHLCAARHQFADVVGQRIRAARHRDPASLRLLRRGGPVPELAGGRAGSARATAESGDFRLRQSRRHHDQLPDRQGIEAQRRAIRKAGRALFRSARRARGSALFARRKRPRSGAANHQPPM